MSLYDELGGGEAIEVALDLFYERVMDDSRVSRFFDGLDVTAIKRKQRAFLSLAFGGPTDYAGRDLRAAHRSAVRSGLDDLTFDVFMSHFRATLHDLGVPATRVEEVMAIAEGGRAQVLNRV